MGAEVAVHLTNGETINLATEYPKGDPENSVSKEELYRKFMVLTGDLQENQAAQIAENVLSLENIEDLSMLFPENVTVQ